MNVINRVEEDEHPKKSKFPTWAIIVIVVASLILISAISFAIYYFVFRNAARGKSHRHSVNHGRPGHDVKMAADGSGLGTTEEQNTDQHTPLADTLEGIIRLPRKNNNSNGSFEHDY